MFKPIALIRDRRWTVKKPRKSKTYSANSLKQPLLASNKRSKRLQPWLNARRPSSFKDNSNNNS